MSASGSPTAQRTSPSGPTTTAEPDEEGVTRLIYFAEALGTFGTGYLLPPGFVEPVLE